MYSIRKNGKFIQWGMFADVLAIANGRKLNYVRGAIVFGEFSCVRFN